MHTLEHGYHLRMCLLPGEGGTPISKVGKSMRITGDTLTKALFAIKEI